MPSDYKRAYVTILTFEGSTRPFEVTYADILTQFFTDYNTIGTGVRSLIVNEKADVELVVEPNYEKQLVSLKNLRQIVDVDVEYDATDDYAGHCYPVTFIFCHGGGRDKTDSKLPAVLNFGEDPVHNYVWACDNEFLNFDAVTLHDLIRATNLVMLLCCHGGDIVNDYISEQEKEMNHNIPEIFFFDCGGVYKISHVILVCLLMQIIDSDEDVGPDPPNDRLIAAVKNGIITILNTVKWCEDAATFWGVLVSLGCVSGYRAEKHGLPPTNRIEAEFFDILYRFSGQTWTAVVSERLVNGVFADFQTLTLVVPGRGSDRTPVKRNYMDMRELDTKTTRVIKEKIQENKGFAVVQKNGGKKT